MRPLLTLAALAPALLWQAAPAMAQTYADPAALDRAVAEFTGAPLGSPGGASAPVDRRLRLAPCPDAPLLAWYGTRHDTVTVQCPAIGWRLFVPVAGGDTAASAPPAVMRGDAVTIELAGDGFALSQSGEALDGGAQGTWIRVRTGNGRSIRARVVRPGVVGIALP